MYSNLNSTINLSSTPNKSDNEKGKYIYIYKINNS